MKPTHFFKIIHDQSQSLHQGTLVIPKKFVEKYGEDLPETIFLKPPNGAEWKISLVKNGDKIWFQKGWKEFAKHQSLAHGHLLVFKYQGTSTFRVHIFDMSALEIKYPLNKREEAGAKRVSNDAKGNKLPKDANLEGNCVVGQKRKADLSFGICQHRGKGSVKVENTSKLQKVAVHLIERKCKGKQVITAKKLTTLDKSSTSREQVNTAKERACSFKTCNPSFPLDMYPSYIIGYGPLNFPRKFVKKHLDLNLDSDSDKKQGDIHLRVSNGKVYPLRYLMRKGNTLPRFELTSGWKTVVIENNLKVGDACTFELIHRTELTFQVHIFRKMEKPDSSTPQKPSKMREVTQGERKPVEIITSGKQIITAKKVTTLKRGRSFKTCSQSASFHVVMHRTHIEDPSRLNLPYKFGERHLDLGKEDGDINLQLLNGKVWPAKFLIKKYETRTRFVVTGGWKTFVKDNDLKVGDVCNFELIPGTQFTFKVYIFKDSIGKHTTQLVQHLKNLPKLEKLLKDEEIKSES